MEKLYASFQLKNLKALVVGNHQSVRGNVSHRKLATTF